MNFSPLTTLRLEDSKADEVRRNTQLVIGELQSAVRDVVARLDRCGVLLARMSADQTGIAATTWTAVDFDTEDHNQLEGRVELTNGQFWLYPGRYLLIGGVQANTGATLALNARWYSQSLSRQLGRQGYAQSPDSTTVATHQPLAVCSYSAGTRERMEFQIYSSDSSTTVDADYAFACVVRLP